MMASAIWRESMNTPKKLYKFLMRRCEKLPPDAQNFYRHSIRQSFKQHVVEPDPERVQQIMDKALYDAEWIMKKYKVNIAPEAPKK